MKKDDVSLKINLEKEIKNADDDEYIDYPPLQNVNMKSQSHEKNRNRLLLKKVHNNINWFDIVKYSQIWKE